MGRKLFVGNLSYSTTDDRLREIFARAGTVESAAVLTDKMTGRSRGFGFVEMSSDEEAQGAITQLNGMEVDGRAITVNEARERTPGFRPRPGGFAPQSYDEGNRSGFGGGTGAGGGSRFPKDGGSRRGLRGRKRSL